jgi:general L-amino acid transport system permease protein
MTATWKALFGSKGNAALTLAMLFLLWLAIPPFVEWALVHATWSGLSRKTCAPDGACWAFVRARFPLFIYGRYPLEARWRVDLVLGALVLLSLGAVFAPRGRGWCLGLLLSVVPIGGGLLLTGGFLGLSPVPSSDWGGLMLNVSITFITVVVSLPLGIALAFARQSELPILRWGAITFIEAWRGSPLLALLFMGLIMLPLFLPNGVTVENLIRAIIVLTLFESAYMAETVRGALQGVGKGQTEAALALGLHSNAVKVLVVLPQAMRIAIPGIINLVVDLFKDTTLISIVGLFDLMGVINQSLKDPNWLGLANEGYTFAILLFFVMCLVISLAGQRLERRYGQGTRR